MSKKRPFEDDEALYFEDYQRELLRGPLCPRSAVSTVAQQSRAYSALLEQESLYRGKRMMVALSASIDDLSNGLELGRRVQWHEYLKVKVAAAWLAQRFCPSTPVLDEDACSVPLIGDDDDVSAVFLADPYSLHDEHDLMRLFDDDRAYAFVLDTDSVANFIQHRAGAYGRLDEQFHCRAWDADEEWWAADEDQRGTIDEYLVNREHGNALAQPPSRQPTLTETLRRAPK